MQSKIITLSEILNNFKNLEKNNEETYVREIEISNENFKTFSYSLEELREAFGSNIIPILKICNSDCLDSICGCGNCFEPDITFCSCKGYKNKDYPVCNVCYLNSSSQCEMPLTTNEKIKIVIPEGEEIVKLNKNYTALSIISNNCKIIKKIERTKYKNGDGYKMILEISKKSLLSDYKNLSNKNFNKILDILIGHLDGKISLANIIEKGEKKQVYFDLDKSDLKNLKKAKIINYKTNYNEEFNLEEIIESKIPLGKLIEYTFLNFKNKFKELFDKFNCKDDLKSYIEEFSKIEVRSINIESKVRINKNIYKIFLFNVISLTDMNILSYFKPRNEMGLYDFVSQNEKWIDSEEFTDNFSANLFLFLKVFKEKAYSFDENEIANIVAEYEVKYEKEKQRSQEFDLKNNEIILISDKGYLNSTTKQASKLILDDKVDELPIWSKYVSMFLNEITYCGDRSWTKSSISEINNFDFPDIDKFCKINKRDVNNFIFGENLTIKEQDLENLSNELMEILCGDFTKELQGKICFHNINDEIIIEMTELNWIEMAQITISCSEKIISNKNINIQKRNELLSKIVIFLKRFEHEINEHYEDNEKSTDTNMVISNFYSLIEKLKKCRIFNCKELTNLEDIVMNNLKEEKLAPSIFFKCNDFPKEKQLSLALEQVKNVILGNSVNSICDSEIGSGKTLITICILQFLAIKGYDVTVCVDSNSFLLKEYLRYLANENVIVVTGPFWKGKCTVQVGKKLAGKVNDKIIYMKRHIFMNDIFKTLHDEYNNLKGTNENGKAPISLIDFKSNGKIILFAESYSNFKYMLEEYRKSIEMENIIDFEHTSNNELRVIDSFDLIVVDDCEVKEVPKFYNKLKKEYLCEKEELINYKYNYYKELGVDLCSNLETLYDNNYYIFKVKNLSKTSDNLVTNTNTDEDLIDISGNCFDNKLKFKFVKYINKKNIITDDENNSLYFVTVLVLDQDISILKNILVKKIKVRNFIVTQINNKFYLEDENNLKYGIYESDNRLYFNGLHLTSTMLINADISCKSMNVLPQIYSDRANMELFDLECNRLPWFMIVPELKEVKENENLNELILNRLNSTKVNLTNFTIENSYAFPELYDYIKKNLFIIFSLKSWQFKFRELTKDFLKVDNKVTYIGEVNESNYIKSYYKESEFFKKSKKLYIVNNTHDLYFKNCEFRIFCFELYEFIILLLNQNEIHSEDLNDFKNKKFDFGYFELIIDDEISDILTSVFKFRRMLNFPILFNFMGLYVIFKIVRGENLKDMICHLLERSDNDKEFILDVNLEYLSIFEEVINKIVISNKDFVGILNKLESKYIKKLNNIEFLSVDKARGANLDYFVGEVYLKDIKIEDQFINQYLGRAGRSFLVGACWFLRGYVSSFDSSNILSNMIIEEKKSDFKNEELEKYLENYENTYFESRSRTFDENKDLFALIHMKNLFNNNSLKHKFVNLIKDLNDIELTLNKSEIETLVDGFPSNKNRPKNGKFVKQKKGAYFYNCKGRALLSFFRSTVLRYLITIFFRTHIDKKDDSYLKNLKSFHDDTGYINDIFEKEYDGKTFSSIIGKYNFTLETFLKEILKDNKNEVSEFSCKEILKHNEDGVSYVDRIFEIDNQLYIIIEYNGNNISENFEIGSRIYDVKLEDKVIAREYLDKNNKNYKSIFLNKQGKWTTLFDIINSEREDNNEVTCCHFVNLLSYIDNFLKGQGKIKTSDILRESSCIAFENIKAISIDERLISNILDKKIKSITVESAFEINTHNCSIDEEDPKFRLLKKLYSALLSYKNFDISEEIIYNIMSFTNGLRDIYQNNSFKFNELCNILESKRTLNMRDFVNDLLNNYESFKDEVRNFCLKIEYIFNFLICMYFLSTYKLIECDKRIFIKIDENFKLITNLMISLRSVNGSTNRLLGYDNGSKLKKTLLGLTHIFGIKINRTKLLNEFESNVESIYTNFLQGKKSYEYTKTENHLITYNYKIESKLLSYLDNENLTLLINDVNKYILNIYSVCDIVENLKILQTCSIESSSNLVELKFNNDVDQYIQFIRVIRMKNFGSDLSFIEKYVNTFTKSWTSGEAINWADALGLTVCLLQMDKLYKSEVDLKDKNNLIETNYKHLECLFNFNMEIQNIFDMVFSLKIGYCLLTLNINIEFRQKIKGYIESVSNYVSNNGNTFFKNLVTNMKKSAEYPLRNLLTFRIMSDKEFDNQLKELSKDDFKLNISAIMKEAFLINIDECQDYTYVAINLDGYVIPSQIKPLDNTWINKDGHKYDSVLYDKNQKFKSRNVNIFSKTIQENDELITKFIEIACLKYCNTSLSNVSISEQDKLLSVLNEIFRNYVIKSNKSLVESNIFNDKRILFSFKAAHLDINKSYEITIESNKSFFADLRFSIMSSYEYNRYICVSKDSNGFNRDSYAIELYFTESEIDGFISKRLYNYLKKSNNALVILENDYQELNNSSIDEDNFEGIKFKTVHEDEVIVFIPKGRFAMAKNKSIITINGKQKFIEDVRYLKGFFISEDRSILDYWQKRLNVKEVKVNNKSIISRTGLQDNIIKTEYSIEDIKLNIKNILKFLLSESDLSFTDLFNNFNFESTSICFSFDEKSFNLYSSVFKKKGEFLKEVCSITNNNSKKKCKSPSLIKTWSNGWSYRIGDSDNLQLVDQDLDLYSDNSSVYGCKLDSTINYIRALEESNTPLSIMNYCLSSTLQFEISDNDKNVKLSSLDKNLEELKLQYNEIVNNSGNNTVVKKIIFNYKVQLLKDLIKKGSTKESTNTNRLMIIDKVNVDIIKYWQSNSPKLEFLNDLNSCYLLHVNQRECDLWTKIFQKIKNIVNKCNFNLSKIEEGDEEIYEEDYEYPIFDHKDPENYNAIINYQKKFKN